MMTNKINYFHFEKLKKHVFLILLMIYVLLFGVKLHAQEDGVIDDVGDIMIVGTFEAGPGDGIAFLALDEIPNNQIIRFTDKEWDGSSFETGEGYVEWINNTGNELPKGTVVILEGADDGNGTLGSVSANIGQACECDSGFNFTQFEQFVAFTGDISTPNFITAFSFGGGDATHSYANMNLTLGSTRFDAASEESPFPVTWIYNGSTECFSGNAACQTQIYTPSNWTNNLTYPDDVPTSWSFVESIPEIIINPITPTVSENGASSLLFRFTRNGDTSSSLMVNFSISGTAADADYTVVTGGTGLVTYSAGTNTGTITFPANSSTVDLSVTPAGDTDIEADETVVINVL
ncbi:MAG: hypothetical protein R3E32_26695 [Chitinophagales bacterium]